MQLKLKQFTDKPNAGDVASAFVVANVLNAKIEVIGPSPAGAPNLLAIGSILQWADADSVVWGSGFLSEFAPLRARPRRVLAVRGPHSGRRLRDMDVDCPEVYGDPGALISDLVPFPRASRSNVGVVPHYVDADAEFVARARAAGAFVISASQPLGDYLAQLASCSYVVSSSLHGVVFAHSYGIPAVWIELSAKVVGSGFKFRDYFASVGVENVAPLKADTTLAEAVARCAPAPRPIDRNALRQALHEGQKWLTEPWEKRTVFPLKSFQAASEEERGARRLIVERLRREGGSDLARWREAGSHAPDWRGRGRRLAGFVRPGESVFEIGAGLSVVPAALPPGCHYTGSDLAPLTDGLLTFDLNAERLDAAPVHDVALLSGVMEYVNDIDRAVEFFARTFSAVVCSYAGAKDWSESALLRRRYSGWVTDDGEAAFASRFAQFGYEIADKAEWKGQTLFRFERAAPAAEPPAPDTKAQGVALARAAQGSANWRAALTHWDACLRAFRDDPAAFDWRVARAGALLHLGRFAEAEAEFAALAAASRHLSHALPGLARVAGLQSRWDLAAERWSACLSAFPEAPARDAWRAARGGALLNLGRFAEAEREFTSAALAEPGLRDGLVGLAQVAARREDWALAEARWRVCLDRFPDAPAAWRRAHAVALEKSGDGAAACEAWRRIVEQSPDDRGALYNLALSSLSALGPGPATVAYAEAALRASPDDVRALKLRAKVDAANGGAEVALACHMRCAELEPFEIAHFVDATAAAFQAGDEDAAARLVASAPPELAEGELFRARVVLTLRRMHGDFEGGLALIAGLDEWALDAAGAAAVGHFLHAAHRFEALEAAMRRAFGRFPTSPEIVGLYLTGVHRMRGEADFRAIKASILGPLAAGKKADALLQLLPSLLGDAEARLAIDRLSEREGKGEAIAPLKFAYRGERAVLDYLRTRLGERPGRPARLAARLISATIEDQERFDDPAPPEIQQAAFHAAQAALAADLAGYAAAAADGDLVAEAVRLGGRARVDWTATAESFATGRALAHWLADRLRKLTPTSFIRLGDGEGAFLPYAPAERRFQSADARAVQQVWWGGTRLDAEAADRLSEALREAVRNADLIGAPPPRRLLMERGKPKGLHMQRALGAVLREVGGLETLSQKALTSCHAHTDLDQWDLYGPLFEAAASVSVISCHDLGDALSQRFAVRVRRHHRIAPEFSFGAMFGAPAAGGGDFFEREFEPLMQEVSPQPGELFLVAAGFLGKLLCERIRARGGVGLDIGSVADSWLDFATRHSTQAGPNGRPRRPRADVGCAEVWASQNDGGDAFYADCGGPYELSPAHVISCWEDKPTTGSERAVIAALAPMDLLGKRVLHMGIGNCELPGLLKARECDYVGVTVSRPELERFKARFGDAPGLRALLLNKYDPRAYGRIEGEFDLIIDTTIKGYACCERHFAALMDFYASRLKLGGSLATTELGLRWGWSGYTHEAYTPGAQLSPQAAAGRTLSLEALQAFAARKGLALRRVEIDDLAANPNRDIVLFLDRSGLTCAS